MSTPQLRFRLPGRWFSVDLSSTEATAASIRRIAKDSVGPADDRAPERARVRHQLEEAVAAGARGDLRAIMFSTEIALGTPLPVTLLVFEPADLRMSPAIGTAPQAVLAVMAEGLRELDPIAHASMVEVRGPGAPALRTHRVEPVADGSEADGSTRLSADYWIPVPGTKQMLLVRFSTPLGELENMMCALFDEYIAVSYFTNVRPPSLREQLLAVKG
ncbi:hypothetical protein FVO59_07575 [Microbacterium esteraromaticum]|uniref:Uncharacterized protein n=1 Tax=Microbacterium esteraromaticum TaxID=57043 RepID=A0A7D8AFK9_9MICO|nr:hypothetical protein [Microbacterium esteraromaticum]QMU97102.1 hypothetical protein FVO59_07575 [Microbacterium esteraromaticum]